MLSQAVKDRNSTINRFKDIPFVIDEIIRWNEEKGKWNGVLDTDRIAIMGHSFGAKTVLGKSGEQLAGGRLSFKD